ncbi:MAG: hypothetical protein H5U38_07880 [Calditrichaeota bacterium]|nr:hypothetical protein [Calditrichota bacterium]
MESSGTNQWLRALLLAWVLCLWSAGLMLAAGKVELTVLSGAVCNAKSPLLLEQEGWPDLHLKACFRSRPLSFPLYYALRVARGASRRLEVELVHDKLYLENPPAEVQSFAVTHGFNLLFVNLAWQKGSWALRAGGGPVLAHPETVVRGQRHPESGGIFGGGYHVSGPAIQVALGRCCHIWRQLSLLGEAKLTVARARFPIAGGHATVTNPAVHLLLGLSVGPSHARTGGAGVRDKVRAF